MRVDLDGAMLQVEALVGVPWVVSDAHGPRAVRVDAVADRPKQLGPYPASLRFRENVDRLQLRVVPGCVVVSGKCHEASVQLSQERKAVAT